MPNKKLLISILSYCTLFLVVSWLITYYRHDFLSLFQQIELTKLWPLLIIQIPLIAINGLPFKTLCLPLGFNIRWQDWAGLSFIANFLNQVLPYRPGLGVRYLYLNQKYKISLQQFIYVSLAYLLITCATATVLVVISWWFSNISLNNSSQFTYIIFGIFSIVVLIALYKLKSSNIGSAININNHNSKIFDKLKSFYTNSRFIFEEPKYLCNSAIILLISNLFTVLSFYLLFDALNAPITVAHCALLVGITTLSMLFPLTPGNIGIAESILGGVTQSLYGDFSIGFSAIAIFRGCQLVISLTFGSVFSLLILDKHIVHVYKQN